MNPDIHVVIRPHPLMFENHIRSGKISEDELQCYINTINSISNISFDNNSSYENAIKEADLILSDFTGLLVEMFLMGKRIAYTGEKTNIKKEFHPMIESFYEVKTWKQFLNVFHLLRTGNDTKEKQRNIAITKFWTFNVKNAADNIVNDIKRECL